MGFKRVLLASVSALAIVAAGDTFAQQATLVTPTASTNATAGVGLPAGGFATVCNTVNTTAANNTVTITPGAGQYVYVTGLYLDIVQDVTGLNGVATASWTGMGTSTNAAFYSLATVVPTSGDNGGFRQITELYTPPLRSASAGTAVTWAPSAQANHVIFCPRITYYLAQ